MLLNRFPTPLVLAPMEGITDRTFRRLVCALGGVGGACTEFIRVTVAPVPRRVIARELGEPVPGVPVAAQLMAAEPTHVAASAANATAAGASWIDLNFGCPAPTVFGHCAGSALLADPDRLAAIVRAARSGTALPVSAKVRAGINDPARLEDCVLAAAEAGAALVTVHGRLRRQSYAEPATWAWIARAVAALRPLGVPVCGNGSVDQPEDAARMRAETGCDLVMVGRAALADPWMFRQVAGGPSAAPVEVSAFARNYHAAVAADAGAGSAGAGSGRALSKLKQWVKYLRAGNLFRNDPAGRQQLLRCTDAETILADLDHRARQAVQPH